MVGHWVVMKVVKLAEQKVVSMVVRMVEAKVAKKAETMGVKRVV